MRTLRRFSGNSRSLVELVEINGSLRVRKTFDIERNLTQLSLLKSHGFNTPDILEQNSIYYDMQYIPHIDIKSMLLNGNSEQIMDFLVDTFSIFSSNCKVKDYSETYDLKLSQFPWARFSLPFDKKALLQKLPRKIPSSIYHGDFTLENVIYGRDGRFYLIDPLSSPYNSYVFDLAKLRQDIQCKWFIRNENLIVDSKLNVLDSKLSEFEFYASDTLLILMLMRILPYVVNSNDQQFLEKEILRLWK